MPFLESLQLSRFRGIETISKPIRFSKFNVLIGRNNSSKSTILQAAYLLPDPRVRDAVTTRSKLDELSDMIQGNGRQPLRNLDLVYRYTKEAVIEATTELGKFITKISYNGISTTWENRPLGPDEPAISSIMFGSNETAKLSELRSLVAFVSSHSLQEMVRPELWASIEEQGVNTKVAEEVSGTVSEKFTELLVRFNEVYLRKEVNKRPVYIRAMDMGTGVKESLSALLYLATVRPKLALLDDFEGGMHPSMTRFMLEHLMKSNCQVILATQSIDTLYELADISAEGTQVIMLNKGSESDILEHQTLDLNALKELLEANRDPRKLATRLGL